MAITGDNITKTIDTEFEGDLTAFGGAIKLLVVIARRLNLEIQRDGMDQKIAQAYADVSVHQADLNAQLQAIPGEAAKQIQPMQQERADLQAQIDAINTSLPGQFP